MELNNVIKRILKEEFTIQMCKAPEVNKKFREYKIYRNGKCGTQVFDEINNNIKKINNYPKNVIDVGMYSGKTKNEALLILNKEKQKKLYQQCGGVMFKGKESSLNGGKVDPCTIVSIVNDYTKNVEARKAYNKTMGYPEDEDIFSGGPISPMI